MYLVNNCQSQMNRSLSPGLDPLPSNTHHLFKLHRWGLMNHKIPFSLSQLTHLSKTINVDTLGWNWINPFAKVSYNYGTSFRLRNLPTLQNTSCVPLCIWSNLICPNSAPTLALSKNVLLPCNDTIACIFSFPSITK